MWGGAWRGLWAYLVTSRAGACVARGGGGVCGDGILREQEEEGAWVYKDKKASPLSNWCVLAYSPTARQATSGVRVYPWDGRTPERFTDLLLSRV